MRCVIFLDIDGVLAPWGSGELDRGCVDRLNRLAEDTDALLVLTSSWREHTPLTEIEAALQRAGLTRRLHSATPVLPADSRGAEIATWLDAYGEPVAMVILDDEPVPPFGDRQVRTDEYEGLTPDHVRRALAVVDDGT